MIDFSDLTDQEIEAQAQAYLRASVVLAGYSNDCERELQQRELARHPEIQEWWKRYALKVGHDPDQPVVFNYDRFWYEADGVLLAHGNDIEKLKQFFTSRGIA
jgi:hypothetical protein